MGGAGLGGGGGGSKVRRRVHVILFFQLLQFFWQKPRVFLNAPNIGESSHIKKNHTPQEAPVLLNRI